MTSSRREFLSRAMFAAVPVALLARQQRPGQAPPPARPPADTITASDTLYNPSGRASAAVGPLDNDPGIIAIERKLRCTCGCTLDVYTCRTTDFSCTYSPAMHQDVIAAVQGGGTPEQVLQAFVAKYGETVLMAPAPSGFNLAGYLVPGLTVISLGLVLIAWLVRKRGDGSRPVGPGPVAAPADADQLERLRRALDDVDA